MFFGGCRRKDRGKTLLSYKDVRLWGGSIKIVEVVVKTIRYSGDMLSKDRWLN